MPLLICLGILAVVGISGAINADRGYTYTSNNTDSMLREMTGKSRAEKRRILRKYGRK